MGYLGVKTMVAHIRGEPVERRIDTGVRLVTRDNMNDADAKELLHPDLSRWLKTVAAPRFEMRGIGKAFGATVALDGVGPGGAPGRGLRARRPERRRQEHADGDPRRRDRAGRGVDDDRRPCRTRRAIRSRRAAPASR